MDALTAGIALILVQLCVALVMAGIFHAVPAEKCTREWAVSGVCVAIGVLMVVLNGGAPRYPVLIIGNNILILGLVFQWSGIRTFYRKSGGYPGWAVALAFFVLYNVLLWQHAPVAARAALSAIAILAMLILNLREVWVGRRASRSFGTMLALAALALLVIGYAFRVIASLSNIIRFLPDGNQPLEVTLLYLVPIAGSLLLTNALLLLYFERVVADKHHLATHDELTSMLNRRAITAAGERELELATRLHLALSVAFIDIDHFKQINDQRGHDAGDRVIAGVADALKKACRGVDLVGRYGGEEFCAIFPGVGVSNVADIGERLLQAVRQYGAAHGGVTISIGLATLTPQDQDRSWTTLVQRADIELYKAKKAGRDRCSIAA